jgi:hypothetical protein
LYDIYVIKTPATKGSSQIEEDIEDHEQFDQIDFIQDLELGDAVEEINEEICAENDSNNSRNSNSNYNNNVSSNSSASQNVSEDLKIARLVIDTIAKTALASIRNDIVNVLQIGTSEESAINGDEVEEELKKRRYVIAFDGEQFQIKAITEAINDLLYGKIEWFKLAAMCSALSQPNDKMVSFRMLKFLTKGIYNKRTRVFISDQTSPYVTSCENLLKELPKASRQTFLLFLTYLPTFLSEAYTMSRISEGWHKSGLFPYNPAKILSYWPLYRDLTADTTQGIRNIIPNLVVRGRSIGFLTDDEVKQEISHLLPESCLPVYKDLQTYPVNRWRCMVEQRRHNCSQAKKR